MASTYVNNLRLEEMANGENSGTWGTKTNVNLELIGQSTAWGTRAIADASTDNITIADGSADADRCLGLKLTGGGQACTVTLLPNTSSKTWFMYNATSYTLTFTCGSGANVAIPAGQTKVIATDGLGSGGVVHDLLTGVSAAGDLNVAGDIITASTLQATGDTAAGDDAAIGYTAAEGLILTGQGSTNDVTIKNDADADVIEIPTGTVNVTMQGTLGVTGLVTASGGVAATGNVTATGTVEPAGDTAASDNAAIGYTAAEGLILTGQGSTNDVTIKNDADADVLEIPTGTTNVTVVGNVSAGGTIELGHATDTTLSRVSSGLVAIEGNNIATLSVTQTFSKGQAGSITALSDASSIATNFALNNHFSVTLGGNRTLANPTNIVAGQSGSFFITQDGTGSRTLAYGSYFDFAGGTAPTLSTAANAIDRIDYIARTTSSLHCVFTGALS